MSAVPSSEEIPSLLAIYETLAVEWSSEVRPKNANKLFDHLHAAALRLRQSEDGREGLEPLLAHEQRGVRLKAAGDCLAWDSAAAVTALEDLVSPPGTHSFTAKITLREYRAGRMRFDW